MKLQSDFVHTHTMLAQLSLPGPNYTDVLAAIHRHLAPRTYLEIAVATGTTIALACTDAAAIGLIPHQKLSNGLAAMSGSFRLRATSSSGITMIRNFDAGSDIFSERMAEIVSEFLAVDYPVLDSDKPGALNLIPNGWPQIESLLPEV